MSRHWTMCLPCLTKVYEDQERCPRCGRWVNQVGRPLALVPVESCDLSTFAAVLTIVGLCGMWAFEAEYGENMKRERDQALNQRDRWERLHLETVGRLEAITGRKAS